jgi:hypothetical protein
VRNAYAKTLRKRSAGASRRLAPNEERALMADEMKILLANDIKSSATQVRGLHTCLAVRRLDK